MLLLSDKQWETCDLFLLITLTIVSSCCNVDIFTNNCWLFMFINFYLHSFVSCVVIYFAILKMESLFLFVEVLFKKVVIYLLERQKGREKRRQRTLQIVGLLLKWLQMLGLGQSEARSLEFQLSLPYESQESKCLRHLLLLSRVHYQGLDRKWNSGDSNHPSGMSYHRWRLNLPCPGAVLCTPLICCQDLISPL